MIAVVFLSACGQDLDKANFPRTTVTQPAGSGQSPSDPITDPAVAIAVLRTVAPCPLLDSNTVGSLGQLGAQSDEGLDQCSIGLTDAGGKALRLTLQLGESLAGGTKNASGLIENLPQLELRQDQNTCSVAAVTSRSPELGVTTEVTYPGGDACGAGRSALRNIIKRLHENPTQLSQPTGSFVAVDPCTIVGDDVIAKALGPENVKTPTGLHNCLWQPKATGPGAKLFLRAVAPPKVDSSSQQVDLGGGVQGVRKMPSPTVAQCLIEWVHRPIAADKAEVVSFLYDNSAAPAAADDSCAKALQVSQAIESKLPKP
jgi:hypothetical protein